MPLKETWCHSRPCLCRPGEGSKDNGDDDGNYYTVLGLSQSYIGIMEKKMEPIIMGYIVCRVWCLNEGGEVQKVLGQRDSGLTAPTVREKEKHQACGRGLGFGTPHAKKGVGFRVYKPGFLQVSTRLKWMAYAPPSP